MKKNVTKTGRTREDVVWQFSKHFKMTPEETERHLEQLKQAGRVTEVGYGSGLSITVQAITD